MTRELLPVASRQWQHSLEISCADQREIQDLFSSQCFVWDLLVLAFLACDVLAENWKELVRLNQVINQLWIPIPKPKTWKSDFTSYDKSVTQENVSRTFHKHVLLPVMGLIRICLGVSDMKWYWIYIAPPDSWVMPCFFRIFHQILKWQKKRLRICWWPLAHIQGHIIQKIVISHLKAWGTKATGTKSVSDLHMLINRNPTPIEYK